MDPAVIVGILAVRVLKHLGQIVVEGMGWLEECGVRLVTRF
ncbi:MAG: hypothetical protein QW453_06520 [Thermoprotei archaeon]